ncbi:DUF547 domain-containing protein [Roseivirga sp.]|uniref:DUF547 domain-containing protein n=1 Tax=Roseivirga sp. TaxID=1964215 RepID=UPI003B525B50
MRTKNIYILSLMVLLMSCTGNQSTFAGVGEGQPDHSLWTALLQRHVDERGFVDYKGMIEDKVKLNEYTTDLSDNPPQDSWSENERLAYWINAYNAFTVKLIVENYPLESIKDLNPTIAIPTVSTVWTKKWFQIGGEDFSLDRIEHKILRREFEEPRIHFAVNCASFSCPPLRNEAFVADKVDRQLDEQARVFINDPVRNKIAPDQVEISQIFSWFKGDFTENQSLIEFLNKYSKVKINPKADVDHMDYDWALNDTN